jgi:hypothetical protein
MNPQTTIFKRTVIEYRDKKPKYPDFEVHEHTIGYFSSLEKAEQSIKKYNDKHRYPKKFGFRIDEYILDDYSYWVSRKSWRTYLSDGSFWDESIEPSMWYEDGKPWKEYFAGRPAEKIHFKKGDLVEVYNGEKVFLLKVGALPHTPEVAQQNIERIQKKYPNISGLVPDNYEPEDMYYVIDRFGGHDHPIPYSVFPARLKINKKLREQLEKAQPL